MSSGESFFFVFAEASGTVFVVALLYLLKREKLASVLFFDCSSSDCGNALSTAPLKLGIDRHQGSDCVNF